MQASAVEVVKRLRGDLQGVKLLAMGQTVFWDEPVKAMLRRALEGSPEFARARATVGQVEREAHLRRLRLMRNTLLTTRGLPYAAARPSWWWFPMVDPSGKRYENLMETAKFHFEDLQGH